MIAIVTDSTACMTKKDAEALGVYYVPMTYSVNGISYTENFVDMCGDYETLLARKKDLRTSQATTDAFMRTFYKLKEEGYDILCLTISSRLSGTYNNAKICARELGTEGICVIDTKTTAAGIFILAKQARRLINEGLSLSETAKCINDMRSRIKIIFSVDDMGPLRSSGRLGPVRQSVSTILNMKPILSCREGRITALKLVRGNREMFQNIVRSVPENVEDVFVQHLQAAACAQTLANELRAKDINVHMRKVVPVLGIHLGLGVVGVVWLEKNHCIEK